MRRFSIPAGRLPEILKPPATTRRLPRARRARSLVPSRCSPQGGPLFGVFQLIELALGLRILGIELDGPGEARDRSVLVVLLLLRLSDGRVGAAREREVVEVQLQPRQRSVGLVGRRGPLGDGDEAGFAEIV